MKLEIRSFANVGPIDFGMSRDQVRNAMGSTARRLRRNEDDDADSDEFASLGVFVEYDKRDCCIAVEISRPSEVVFRGKSLLLEPYASVKEWIKTIDPGIDIDEAGFDSFELGLGVYADLPKRDKKSAAESVIAFCRTYYD